ncbi:AP-4 complex accessory subunit Tepsin-like [Liolophura sinensis]|uniref:AP-4 complex accessory subunit Tepsin-like n=1 Tax=Liolophura sinensis TaxID=3198878 RepID=UPI0031590C29
MERVSFVNKISNVMKATADDESPIPGYLYPEISKITLESDGSCESLLEFLVDRLDRNSCHVKVKVLKLMKYVVENGNPNFAMGLRKKSRGLKEATSFGGPPDPLHGNIPYLLVRKAAKELSELVFDTETVKTLPQSPQNPVLKSKGGMGRSSRNQGMEGFGNTPKQREKTLGSTILTGLNKLVENVTDSGSPGLTMSPIKTSCGDYTPVQIQPTVESERLQTTSPPVNTRPAPRKHIPGRAGGGWEDDLDTEVRLSSGSRSDGSQGQSDRYESSSSTEDWSNEESLVMEVTDKTEPCLLTRTQICHFLKKCPSVNCEKTVEILNRCLLGTEDHIVIKCLQLIEGLLRCDLVNLEFIAATCRSNLISVYHRDNSQIRAKAKKIIRILEKLTSHNNILPIPCDKPSSCKPESTENRVDVRAPCQSDAQLNLSEVSQSPGTSTTNSVDKVKCENILECTENSQQSSPQASAYFPAFFDSTTDMTEDSAILKLNQPRENTPDGIPDRIGTDLLSQDGAGSL